MVVLERLQTVAAQIDESMPWIHGIRSKAEYDELIALMDELVEDYDANQTLIDLLFPVIERYEEDAPEFQAFNTELASRDSGVAVLRVLIDQYGLTLSDFKDEIGAKSTVSMILKGTRNLTLDHMKALSKRFNIPVMTFIGND